MRFGGFFRFNYLSLVLVLSFQNSKKCEEVVMVGCIYT